MPFGRSGEINYDRSNQALGSRMMGIRSGLLLIVLGVIANNLIYLQDLWLGQGHISLDGWRAYTGLLVSIAIILVGMVLVARPRTAD
jgi:hypothetical protein